MFSDLHLGLRWPGWIWWFLKLFGFTNRSRSRPLEVLAVIKQFPKTTVWILGDLFDRPDTSWDDLDQHEQSLLQFLWREKYVFAIRGNHDYDTGLLSENSGIRVEGEDVVFCEGRRTLGFIHFDQFDAELNSKLLCAIADCIEAFAACFGLMQFVRSTWFWQAHAEKVKLGAVAFAKSTGLNFLAGGHRHTEELTRSDGVVFLDCGCSVIGYPFSFALLDGSLVRLIQKREGKYRLLASTRV